MRVILLFFILALSTSCTTQSPLHKRIEDLQFQVSQLEALSVSHGFFIDTDRCFIDYLMCKEKNKDSKKCWGVHERCVINVYRVYEQLKKK